MGRFACAALFGTCCCIGCEFSVPGLGGVGGVAADLGPRLPTADLGAPAQPDLGGAGDLARAADFANEADLDLAKGGDLANVADLADAPDLAEAPDLAPSCTLGTTSDCGQCGHACPGSDDSGTERVCTSAAVTGVCDLICRGDYYDVDGVYDNGCEALDEPAHDSFASATAIVLADVVNMVGQNPVNLHGDIFGDQRRHDAPPTYRINGRDDYYALTALGIGDPLATLTACLGIPDLPADDVYEVLHVRREGDAVRPGRLRHRRWQGAQEHLRRPSSPDLWGWALLRARSQDIGNECVAGALAMDESLS